MYQSPAPAPGNCKVTSWHTCFNIIPRVPLECRLRKRHRCVVNSGNRNAQVKLKIWSCFNLPYSAAPGKTFVELKPTSALLNVAVRMLQWSRSVTDSRRLQQDQSAPRCQRCVSAEPDAATKKNKEASADSSPLISLLWRKKRRK